MKGYYLLALAISSLFFFSCEEKHENPKISTLAAIPISVTKCKVTGLVSSTGSYAITDHGFVYYNGTTDKMDPYSVVSNKVALGNKIEKDTFSTNITIGGTSYYSSSSSWYVRSYITNERGTIYGNAVKFEPLSLYLKSISPTMAKIGDTITINGANFDTTPLNNKVKFENFTATVVSATVNELKVIVPSITDYYSSQYDISVTTGGQTLTLYNVFSLAFSVTGFSPKTGTFGTSIRIDGANFGQISGIMLGNTLVSSYGSSYSSYLNVSIPNSITSRKFKLYVIKGTTKTEVPGGEFTMNSLAVTSISTNKVIAGSSISINGSNFNTSSYNSIFIGQTKIGNLYTYSGSLSATVPVSMSAGDYQVSVCNGVDTVVVPGTLKIVVPSITGISPSSGYWGSDLVVSGHNLNTDYSNVYFNGGYYSAYFKDSTTYKVKVPSSLTPGVYRIGLIKSGSTLVYSPTDFTVLAPTLSSITPTHGTAGTAVVISGAGFGTSVYNVSVKFGSIYATVTSVNNNQINATVPSSVGAGTWSVTVIINGYQIPTSLTFGNP